MSTAPPDPPHDPQPQVWRRVPRLAYLYVPACLSALLLLAFFPLILRLNAGGFEGATGRGEGAYLYRWLAVSGALFMLSGLLYVLALARERKALREPAAGPPAPPA